jgi:regulator of sigma E protease
MVGLLVAVHELGHFTAAKALGVRVLRFSLGFGPPIVRLRGRETEYQVGAVPLGGYVRLLGEDPSDTVAPEDRGRSFADKPLWKRLVVVFAGPAANLLFPLAIYFTFFFGHHELPAAVIGDVLSGGPAAAAGIEPGDRVLEINGDDVRTWEELEDTIDRSAGKSLRLKLRRGDKDVFAFVTPRQHVIRTRTGEKNEQGLIGVTQAPFEPIVGIVDPTSPAARAGLRTGDRIMSVDGRTVSSYGELERALGTRPRRVLLAYLRGRASPTGFAEVRLYTPGTADLVPETAARRQSWSGIASAEFFVAAVEPGSPAEAAGLRRGDMIVAVDGRPVRHWIQLDQELLADPDRRFHLAWQRSGAAGVDTLEADVRQERRAIVDEYGQDYTLTVFGAVNDFPLGRGEMVPIDSRFAYAASHAATRTGETIGLMARGLVALIHGKLPRDTVGGPIMMYRMASVSGEKGWDAFLMMLALISINLGLINLLPIPVLDGGHLLMFAIEAVRRRRLPSRVREAVVMVGLAIIVGITVLALKNDIVRYLIR